eukprot:7687644-Pyramimonas_sp.AAC.1
MKRYLQGTPLCLQEGMSGSGRLSAAGAAVRLKIAFPVDYRIGLDLKQPEHRRLLDQCKQEL